jgi:glycosyltransferase involved in cell wall biosynthesis
MEAMALEVPVIGSHARGVRDLLAGGCGLIFASGVIPDLVRHQLSLLDNPELARRLKANAKERIKRYELGAVLQLYEDLYSEGIKERLALAHEIGSPRVGEEATTIS